MDKIIIVNQIGKEKELTTDYEYGDKRTEIDEVINFLIDAKHDGATHIEFDGVADYDCSSCLEELTIKTVTVTEESDEDLRKRIETEEISKQNTLLWTKKLELQELERLKKKYE